MSVYVGIDVHRKRSQVAVVTGDGTVELNKNVVNGSEPMLRLIGDLPPGTPVAFEAAFGWGWLAALLEDYGFEAHLVHPLRCKAIASARLKNDKVDAAILAQLLRAGLLPEAWIAPPEVRALREVVRYRHKLVGQRTSCKDQVHAVLAKLGVPVTHSDVFGTGGGLWLDQLVLPEPYAAKVASLRALIGVLDGEIARLGQRAAGVLGADPGYAALRELPGIGPVLAAVIIAEIGDVTRFRRAGQLCSWAGLTPRHYESDTKVIRGHVSKQGSKMLRWALVEAIQHQPAGTRPRQARDAIIARRGKEARNIAKTAAARVLLTQVFYALRDGHVRSAGRPAA